MPSSHCSGSIFSPLGGLQCEVTGFTSNHDERLFTMKKKNYSIDFGLLLFIFVLGIIGYRIIQYYRILNILHTIEPNQVTTFTIYPGRADPSGHPIKFTPPDTMISEFFQSVTDIHFSLPDRGDVGGIFVEIVYNDTLIQMQIYMRSRKRDIVFGELGKWRSSSSTSYGEFRSRKLFQWYQKYKDRWLEPERKEGSEEGEKKRREEEQKLRS